MLIVPAKNVTLVCDQVNTGQAQAEKFALPEGENCVEIAVKVHTIFAAGSGTATPVFAVAVWGSQDGVNWVTEVGPHSVSMPGISTLSGQMATAFLSFLWTLTLTGGQPPDWGVVTFDIHGNLKRL